MPFTSESFMRPVRRPAPVVEQAYKPVGTEEQPRSLSLMVVETEEVPRSVLIRTQGLNFIQTNPSFASVGQGSRSVLIRTQGLNLIQANSSYASVESIVPIVSNQPMSPDFSSMPDDAAADAPLAKSPSELSICPSESASNCQSTPRPRFTSTCSVRSSEPPTISESPTLIDLESPAFPESIDTLDLQSLVLVSAFQSVEFDGSSMLSIASPPSGINIVDSEADGAELVDQAWTRCYDALVPDHKILAVSGNGNFKIVPLSTLEIKIADQENLCGICAGSFKESDVVQLQECGHYFEIDCIGASVKGGSLECPTCGACIVTPDRSALEAIFHNMKSFQWSEYKALLQTLNDGWYEVEYADKENYVILEKTTVDEKFSFLERTVAFDELQIHGIPEDESWLEVEQEAEDLGFDVIEKEDYRGMHRCHGRVLGME